jgi:hypothetical protein
MRLICRNWRVRFEAGEQGRVPWFVSVGPRKTWWSFWRGYRQVRVVVCGLYLHVRWF